MKGLGFGPDPPEAKKTLTGSRVAIAHIELWVYENKGPLKLDPQIVAPQIAGSPERTPKR